MGTVQEITAAVTLGLTPDLRVDGYKKSGTRFHSVGQESIRVLSVQSSRWNTRTEGRLTINLGVHFAALHQLAEAIPFKGLPKEYDCEVRIRIGELMPARQDYWWTVGTDTKADVLAGELRDAWKKYARLWLEHNSHLSNAAAELENRGQYFMAAAAQLLLGRRENAEELTRLALRDYPHAASRTRDWAQKHDLSI